MSAKLSIVATPIGHLKDITLRALETLREADLIYCEDTRQTLKLLRHYEIQKPLRSLHEHNERGRIAEVLSELDSGKKLALVSDAGTPLISDPGYRLVQAVAEAGYALESIPGACAAVAALVVSGLTTDRFYFVGFLPPKSAARRRELQALATHPSTLIFYESPHRIQKLLAEAAEILGPRPAALIRELSKIHEEILRADLQALAHRLQPRSWKGEFVLIVGKSSPKA